MKIGVRCKRCNRRLTAPKSVSRGYGPVCINKIGEPLKFRMYHNVKIRKDLIPLEEFFSG